eukprot:GEMP01037625.1.p1 GENE.GEMP01037625.1~~GEMP01037625.1.p1  ORF type:complete len:568 (+),score=111.31 GEMP01037625.1:56-1705(+)
MEQDGSTPSTRDILLTQSQSKNADPTLRQNAGYSGTPMWKIAQEREKKAQLDGAIVQDDVNLPGFEKLTDDWWWNETRQIGYMKSTDLFYKVNPATKDYIQIHQSQETGITFHADATFMQGRRPKQEDRHVMVKDLQKAGAALKLPLDHLDRPAALFAVYDGHQGTACAEYCAKNFHMKLLPRLSANPGEWTDDMVRAAFKQSFEELDEDFLAKHRGIPDGCTAVIALLLGSRLFVAWVGDSRCIMMEDGGRAHALTKDHKPELEEARVNAAGGCVIKLGGCLRVAAADFDEKYKKIRQARAQGLGTIAKDPVALAVARSFGDREFKIPNKLLIATPDVEVVHLDSSHKGIMLLCDGVLDVMKDDEVAGLMSRNMGRPRAACGEVVNEAFNRGSEDNLTAICVFFEPPSAVTADDSPASKRRKTSAVESIRCRHILIKHNKVRNPIDKVRGNTLVTLTTKEAEEKIRGILRKLSDAPEGKFTETFSLLCREHSQCSSALKGGGNAGDLGWFKAKKMQKAFSDVAFTLKVDQLSDIVFTDSGVHIIWRTA